MLNNQNKKETLYLLKDVTGFFRPQEMAALVSSSCLKPYCCWVSCKLIAR